MKIYLDCAHLVERFGFRVLDDGTVDIHHLPWPALELLQSELMDACVALGQMTDAAPTNA